MIQALEQLKSTLRPYLSKIVQAIYAILITQPAYTFRVSLMRHGRVVPDSTIDHRFFSKQFDLIEPCPLVSCLLIRRRGLVVTKAAITCFQNQSYQNKELIIVDAVTFDVGDNLSVYLKKQNNHNIIYVRPENERIMLDQLQTIAIDHASGEYICQWTDTHLAAPDRLSQQLGALQQLNVDACLLERSLLWYPQEKYFAISARKSWDESILCKISTLPTKSQINMSRNSTCVVNILQQCDVALLDQPQLYVNIVRNDDQSLHQEFWTKNSWDFTPGFYSSIRKELDRRLSFPKGYLDYIESQHKQKILLSDRLEASQEASCCQAQSFNITLAANIDIIAPKIMIKQHYQVGVVLTTYNRPHYLKVVLDGLKKSIIRNTIILIIDDGSNHRETIHLLSNFDWTYNLDNVTLIKIFKTGNNGVEHSLRLGWEFLRNRCDYLCNLDSDALVKPHWLNALTEVHQAYTALHPNAQIIVTGFNTDHHVTLSQTENFVSKQTIGGINMFFHTSLYLKYFQEALNSAYWDHRVVDKLYGWERGMTDRIRLFRTEVPPIPKESVLVCTKPSVVQHIGIDGLNGGIYSCDYAKDF